MCNDEWTAVTKVYSSLITSTAAALTLPLGLMTSTVMEPLCTAILSQACRLHVIHCSAHHTLHPTHCTLHTAHDTLHTAHYTLCTQHTATLHTTNSTLHPTHYTLQTVYKTHCNTTHYRLTIPEGPAGEPGRHSSG